MRVKSGKWAWRFLSQWLIRLRSSGNAPDVKKALLGISSPNWDHPPSLLPHGCKNSQVVLI